MRDILLLIIGAILGWLGQWLFYRYQQRDQQRQAPNIVFSRVTRHDQILLELRNLGPDSLSEMELKISWVEENREHHRTLEQFFRPDQDERLAAPAQVELLGVGERYIVSGLPQRSDDGIVDVAITGLGVTSQRLYSAKTQLTVRMKERA